MKNYKRSKWTGNLVDKNKGTSGGTIAGWAKIRKAILDRDGRACRICGNDGDGTALNAHHIDWDRGHNQTANLVTLCRDCHQAVHRDGYKPELFEDWPTPWGIVE